MYYAEFYHDVAGNQPGCGDRSVLILDGRESFSRSAAISPLQSIREVKHASNY